jgi:hypothetical protein
MLAMPPHSPPLQAGAVRGTVRARAGDGTTGNAETAEPLPSATMPPAPTGARKLHAMARDAYGRV